MRIQFNIFRIILYFAAFLFALIIKDGLAIFIFTSTVILASLVLYFYAPPSFYKLSMFFELGFLYLMSTEGISHSSKIIYETSYDYYCTGSQYINLSFVIIMIISLLRSFNLYEHKYVNYTTIKFKNKNLFYVLLLFMVAIFLTFMAKKAIKISSLGRLGGNYEITTYNDIPVTSLLDLFLNSYTTMGYVLPALLLYFKYYHNNKLFNYLPYFLIPPIILMQILIGSRTYVLYTLIGILIMYQSRVTRINWSRALFIGIIMIFLSSLMLNYRNFGFSNVQISSVSNRVNKDISSPSDAVLWQCRIVEYYDNNHEYENGVNLLTTLSFWIPRSIWLNKPTMIDYWFIRAYVTEKDFGVNHSVVTGFSGLFYSDFGFWRGLLCCVFLGLFIGQMEFFIFKSVINKRDPYIVFASLSFGIILFFVRAFGSLIPPLTSCFLIIYLFRKIFFTIK
jgi:oligosaccharide repeat unit polymerase